MNEVMDIIEAGDPQELRALFSFSGDDSNKEVEMKSKLWARYFFPDYFKFKDADFHREIIKHLVEVYRGGLKYFVNIAFRGGGKTALTKLFIAFVIANDTEHQRKYIKVLSKDMGNAKQITTDVYNMLITNRHREIYPEVFQKTELKREETMTSFTTSKGVKVASGTVGMDQRGDIQDESRPDFLLFEDIETRKTLRSAIETQAIWDNIQEATTGLSRNGGGVFNCNYLSERGNVHRIVEWKAPSKKVLITPIYTREKGSAWPEAYSVDDIKKLKSEAQDFAGEYLCSPSIGADIFFDRKTLNLMLPKHPIKTVAGFKMFYPFDPSHRYGSGHDVSGGVGLDSSTSVFIDFSTIPNRVVATYKSTTMKPDIFGDEINRQARMYGEPLVAPENNNHGHATIGRLKQLYSNIFTMELLTDTADITPKKSRTYGWSTNRLTKPNMLFAFKKAVEDGHLDLSDEDLINEAKSYSRDDLMDNEIDPRLATRHFDLLMACAIAWQMRNFVQEPNDKDDGFVVEKEMSSFDVY